MLRILITVLLLVVGNVLLAQKNTLPTNKHVIRKELKRLIHEANKVRTENNSQWSRHIKRIAYSGIHYEYNRNDLSYTPDSTIVFQVTEINNPSELYGNDTIWIVFDSKSFCKLDVIDWFHPLSDQLSLLVQMHFPACNEN